MSRNPVFYKGLVVGVIVLFVMTCFSASPSIDAKFAVEPPDNNPPGPPKITGPREMRPGIEEWTFEAIDQDGNYLFYFIWWGDGATSGWYGPFPSGKTVKVSHTYHFYGTVTIKAVAKDHWGLIGPVGTMGIEISQISHSFSIKDNQNVLTSGNSPPEKPKGIGPSSGKSGINYDFVFVSIDPDGDNVSYYIDWADDTNEEGGPYPSGTPIVASHAWYEKGCYLIRCKAIDIYGAESEWLEYEFWVDRSRTAYISLIQLLTERFPILEVFLRIMKL